MLREEYKSVRQFYYFNELEVRKIWKNEIKLLRLIKNIYRSYIKRKLITKYCIYRKKIHILFLHLI